jgi:hypothetical protein
MISSKYIYKNSIRKNRINLETVDESFQNLLNNFKYKEIPQELLSLSKEETKLMITKKSIIPDLVIYNEVFNKNDCFYYDKGYEENIYPRKVFKISKQKTKKPIKKNYTNDENEWDINYHDLFVGIKTDFKPNFHRSSNQSYINNGLNELIETSSNDNDLSSTNYETNSEVYSIIHKGLSIKTKTIKEETIKTQKMHLEEKEFILFDHNIFEDIIHKIK